MNLSTPNTVAYSPETHTQDVVDLDTNTVVGTVSATRLASNTGFRRKVSVFRYRGLFQTDAECAAFIKGVEAVLKHAVSLPKGDWRIGRRVKTAA